MNNFDLVTIERFAELTGLSPEAIRQ